MKEHSFFLVVLWAVSVPLTAPEVLHAAQPSRLPAGYFVSESDMALVLPASVVDTLGRYRVRVARTSATVEEERLLRRAEAVYPPRDSILAAARRNPRVARERARGRPNTIPDGRDVWWYSDGPLRIPFAVTGRALLYYMDLIRRLRARSTWLPGTVQPARTELTYSGTIERRDSVTVAEVAFTDVYVARLSLRWASGPWSRATRVIVLSADGRVLAVEGDGPTAVVSH